MSVNGYDKATKASVHDYATALPEVPITEQRPVFKPTDHELLADFGTVRANFAPDREHPLGTTKNNYAEKNKHRTVLQQHCDYWDTDRDGIIWPYDTYIGVKKWGWNPLLCALVVYIIHFGLSYPTLPSWLPDPFFRIYLDRIHKAKHGSSSMTFDTEGRFSPQHFENIFAKYDRGNKGGLDIGDILRFWQGYRLIFDFFGWSAVMFEWIATYLLIWPADGILRKEDIRGIYDGSIFYVKAEEHAKSQ